MLGHKISFMLILKCFKKGKRVSKLVYKIGRASDNKNQLVDHHGLKMVIQAKDCHTAQNSIKWAVHTGLSVDWYMDHPRFKRPDPTQKKFYKKPKIMVGPIQLSTKKRKKNVK